MQNPSSQSCMKGDHSIPSIVKGFSRKGHVFAFHGIFGQFWATAFEQRNIFCPWYVFLAQYSWYHIQGSAAFMIVLYQDCLWAFQNTELCASSVIWHCRNDLVEEGAYFIWILCRHWLHVCGSYRSKIRENRGRFSFLRPNFNDMCAILTVYRFVI